MSAVLILTGKSQQQVAPDDFPGPTPIIHLFKIIYGSVFLLISWLEWHTPGPTYPLLPAALSHSWKTKILYLCRSNPEVHMQNSPIWNKIGLGTYYQELYKKAIVLRNQRHRNKFSVSQWLPSLFSSFFLW